MTRRETGAAGVKLAGLAVLGVAAFAVDSAWALAGALGVVVAVCAVARVAPANLWRQVRVAVPLVAAIVVAHGILSGWAHGLVVALRILLLVAAASAVTLTTPVPSLLAVVERALWPFRRLGVDPLRAGLVLVMALRFVPLLSERLRAIREAQRARGRERPGTSVLPPLVIGTLRLADELADALDARGLGDGEAR